MRWLTGQEKWDKTFKHAAEKSIRKRRHNEAKARRILDNARDQGLLLSREKTPSIINACKSTISSEYSADGAVQEVRRWGPLDLDDEKPPPSAIAKRRDTVCSTCMVYP